MSDYRNRSDIFRLGGELGVHRLGFGAMRITGEGVWGPPADREAAKRVLRRAVELGVDLIDTADSYGPNVSEELIAEALHPYPDGLVIATKGGHLRPGPGRWEPDGRPEHLREALEGSLSRLRLERIDLYQLHKPDPKVPFEESVGALAEWRREGLIRLVGLSNVSVEQLEAARKITEIASVQNRYNLADRASQPVLERCQELGIAFIPWYPINTGRLEGAVQRVADRHGATPPQVALAWLLASSPVHLPIPGTSSVAHLEENVASTGLRLDHEDMQALAD
jgi:pyridoxine 4-dehydrogenase